MLGKPCPVLDEIGAADGSWAFAPAAEKGRTATSFLIVDRTLGAVVAGNNPVNYLDPLGLAWYDVNGNPAPALTWNNTSHFEWENNSKLDKRSEKNLENLEPDIADQARQLINRLKKMGIDAKITSGYRSCEEQDKLYAQGRTTPGKKVTNAKGGESPHNSGEAFDITIFKDNKPSYDPGAYNRAGAAGNNMGLDWGGRFGDRPHFQQPNWNKD